MLERMLLPPDCSRQLHVLVTIGCGVQGRFGRLLGAEDALEGSSRFSLGAGVTRLFSLDPEVSTNDSSDGARADDAARVR